MDQLKSIKSNIANFWNYNYGVFLWYAVSLLYFNNAYRVLNFHLKCIPHRARITFQVEGTQQQAFFAFLEADQKKVFFFSKKDCSIEYLLM